MKKSRRDILKFGAMAGAGLVIPKFASSRQSTRGSTHKEVSRFTDTSSIRLASSRPRPPA